MSNSTPAPAKGEILERAWRAKEDSPDLQEAIINGWHATLRDQGDNVSAWLHGGFEALLGSIGEAKAIIETKARNQRPGATEGEWRKDLEQAEFDGWVRSELGVYIQILCPAAEEGERAIYIDGDEAARLHCRDLAFAQGLALSIVRTKAAERCATLPAVEPGDAAPDIQTALLERPWSERDTRCGYPLHVAVFNGWPVDVEDKRPMLEHLNEHCGRSGRELINTQTPFNVFVRGFDDFDLPTLEAAKVAAESLARQLPPGARYGCWTDCPEEMRPGGWIGAVRAEAGVFLEVVPMDEGDDSWVLDVQAGGRTIAQFYNHADSEVVADARRFAVAHAARTSMQEQEGKGCANVLRALAEQFGPERTAEILQTKSRSPESGRVLAPVLRWSVAAAAVVVLSLFAAGAWARAADAERAALQAERAAEDLVIRLRAQGIHIPSIEDGR